MDANKEFDKIYCRVETTFGGNSFLANHNVAQRLTKEAVKRIKNYGYDCVEEPMNARGGGFDQLWETVKYLWEMRDVISIILAIIGSIRHYFVLRLRNDFEQRKPIFVLSLNIQKTSPENTSKWYSKVSDKLVGLKLLTNQISKELKEDYPLLNFDQQISASVTSKSFRITLNQAFNKTGKFNNYRIIKLLSKVEETNNQEIHIIINKLQLLTRTHRYIRAEESYWLGSRHKQYFTFFTSRLITSFPTENDSKLKTITNKIRFKLKIRTRLAQILRILTGGNQS